MNGYTFAEKRTAVLPEILLGMVWNSLRIANFGNTVNLTTFEALCSPEWRFRMLKILVTIEALPNVLPEFVVAFFDGFSNGLF